MKTAYEELLYQVHIHKQLHLGQKPTAVKMSHRTEEELHHQFQLVDSVTHYDPLMQAGLQEVMDLPIVYDDSLAFREIWLIEPVPVESSWEDMAWRYFRMSLDSMVEEIRRRGKMPPSGMS